jgi:hypothetical protein
MMPHVDGVELCRRLKDDIATADIPMVMLLVALPPEPHEPLSDVPFIKWIPNFLELRRRNLPGRTCAQSNLARAENMMVSARMKFLLLVVIAALCVGCSRSGDNGIAVPGHDSNGSGASSPKAGTSP